MNDDQIRRYLRELDSLLPAAGRRRRRFLVEVGAHLNDAAEDVGPTAAIERFGSAREVAEAFGAGNATRSTIVALKLLAAALVVRYSVLFIANLIHLGWPAHRWTLLPRDAALHFPRQDVWVIELLVFVGPMVVGAVAIAHAPLRRAAAVVFAAAVAGPVLVLVSVWIVVGRITVPAHGTITFAAFLAGSVVLGVVARRSPGGGAIQRVTPLLVSIGAAFATAALTVEAAVEASYSLSNGLPISPAWLGVAGAELAWWLLAAVAVGASIRALRDTAAT